MSSTPLKPPKNLVIDQNNFCIDPFPANLLLFSPIRLRREATVGEKAPGFFGPDGTEQGNGSEGGGAALDADDRPHGSPFTCQNRESSSKSGQKIAEIGAGPAVGRG